MRQSTIAKCAVVFLLAVAMCSGPFILMNLPTLLEDAVTYFERNILFNWW